MLTLKKKRPSSGGRIRIFDKLFGSMIAKQVAKPYNKIRKKYNLPPVKDIGKIMSKKLDLIPISSFVKERNPYWEPQHILTGFWYQEDTDYQPDKRLQTFLENGEKPILLALGAMSFEETAEKEKLDMFVKAFEKTDHRAVIQGFQKTLKEYELPGTMISVGSVPHSYLFGKCKMVFHHCGFGTAAAALIYGAPSVPVPHVLDQMGFADLLFNLGVASQPLDGNKLREKDIIDRISDMNTHYKERTRKAQVLSAKIKQEDGLSKAVSLIQDAMK